jgi:hypothetical protein
MVFSLGEFEQRGCQLGNVFRLQQTDFSVLRVVGVDQSPTRPPFYRSSPRDLGGSQLILYMLLTRFNFSNESFMYWGICSGKRFRICNVSSRAFKSRECLP